jgi:hypothetical protein
MKGHGGTRIAFALVAVLGAAANVQAATSLKPGPVKVKPLSKEEFADLRAKLGACLVDKSKDGVSKLLEHSDSLGTDFVGMGVQPQMFMFSFRMDLCQKYANQQVTGPLFLKPGALRNLFMEQAYLAKYQAAPKPLLNEKGEPTLAPARIFASKGDLLPQAVAYAQLADCTAANGSELADKVLRTPVGLPAEREAAVALAPIIGQCVTQGQNIALTADTIRALAAEGMWQRYVFVPKPAQASAK